MNTEFIIRERIRKACILMALRREARILERNYAQQLEAPDYFEHQSTAQQSGSMREHAARIAGKNWLLRQLGVER